MQIWLNVIDCLYFVTQDAKPLTTSTISSQSQLTFNCPWLVVLTILHFLHKNENAKIWVLIKCDYWSFVLCNTRCQAFNKNNNNLPIRISLQLDVNMYLLFCTFLGLFLQFSRNVFLHKNESAKVWMLLANCNQSQLTFDWLWYVFFTFRGLFSPIFWVSWLNYDLS